MKVYCKYCKYLSFSTVSFDYCKALGYVKGSHYAPAKSKHGYITAKAIIKNKNNDCK